MKKVIALVLAAATMSLSFVGCSSGKSSSSAASSGASSASSTASKAAAGGNVKGKTVVFIPKVTGNAFFESANKGAQKYAAQWGFTVNYQGSPNAAVADEVQVVNNAIASGADAICISSVDATGLDAALKKAKDAGIAVVTWDSDVSTDARTLMVSQGTPEILGKMLVDMSVDALTKRGKDVKKDAIKYCWHYSQATVADQNSWQAAGEAYIAKTYPKWVNVAKSNYYSEQDAEKAVSIGSSILEAHKDIDLIICNDSTALPGQCKAAQNAGLTKKNITITGFATPSSMRDYIKANVLQEFGLWDCGIQGAMGCYLAAYIAAGNTVKVGDKINIPSIGTVEVLKNDSLVKGQKTSETNNGVVLLPERVVFTSDNVDKYNF